MDYDHRPGRAPEHPPYPEIVGLELGLGLGLGFQNERIIVRVQHCHQGREKLRCSQQS